MNGSIYDFGLQRSALQPGGAAIVARALHGPVQTDGAARDGRRKIGLVGLIANPRSHRNKGIASPWSLHSNVIGRAPRTRAELRDVLTMFAERGIDLLAIDGGDGTVRDVLTCAGDVWSSAWPDVLLLPTGKTNALAVDIGVPAQWSLDDALAAAERGRVAIRHPLEIEPAADPGTTVRGFIFGAGAFVDATALAQRTHRVGAFNGIAVGLALGWGITQTLFGGPDSQWRRGSRIRLDFGKRARRMHDTTPDGEGNRYLLLASTLNRLPIGLKPFGKERPGLKTLVVDAPPRRLAAMIGPLLAGSEMPGLERRGYHRVDSDSLSIDIATSFVLDGETFPPGAYHLREAGALRFVVP